jgi:hypothetical protein
MGCTKISPGCDECYAERETRGKGWGNEPRIRTSREYWRQPLLWNADAPRFERVNGHRRRVFCSHISDVFDNQALPEWRTDLFKLMRDMPRLAFCARCKPGALRFCGDGGNARRRRPRRSRTRKGPARVLPPTPGQKGSSRYAIPQYDDPRRHASGSDRSGRLAV